VIQDRADRTAARSAGAEWQRLEAAQMRRARPRGRRFGEEDSGMTLFQKFVLGARVLLGLIFFVTGIIGLLKLAPFPVSTPQAEKFISALSDTGYLFPAVMAIQTVCGLLLILGFFVPLVLLFLMPIIVNILLYQLFLNHSTIGLLLGFVALALEAGLAYLYRAAFASLFHIRPEPS
jgi:uncharacterized membrane protein YphA (DoxX/SURF4 family)